MKLIIRKKKKKITIIKNFEKCDDDFNIKKTHR